MSFSYCPTHAAAANSKKFILTDSLVCESVRCLTLIGHGENWSEMNALDICISFYGLQHSCISLRFHPFLRNPFELIYGSCVLTISHRIVNDPTRDLVLNWNTAHEWRRTEIEKEWRSNEELVKWLQTPEDRTVRKYLHECCANLQLFLN